MTKEHFKIIPERQFILDAKEWSKSIPTIWDEIQGVADDSRKNEFTSFLD